MVVATGKYQSDNPTHPSCPLYGNPEGDIDRFRNSVLMLRNLPFSRICTSHKPPIARVEADGVYFAI
jgi:hypothetical protein